jgi:HK97 family phage prohead protease
MLMETVLPRLERRPMSIYENVGRIPLGVPELRHEGRFAKLIGHAAAFNLLSEPLFTNVRERIRPGAFKRTLAEGAEVLALFDNDPSKILGRNSAGTLRLAEDADGLRYEIDPSQTSAGREMLASLRRGDLRESSFDFQVREEEYMREGEVLVRELLDVELFGVSIVRYPACPQTLVEARALWPEAADSPEIQNWFLRADRALLIPPPEMFSGLLKIHVRRLEPTRARGKRWAN